MPIGRRLAYDADRGRLWVVCRRCGEWNLTPMEERWEAIEGCERLAASAEVRVSSEHVALVQLRGLELIRIGPALRDEIANWRYGPRLRRRRWRAAANVTVGSVVGIGAFVGIAAGVATTRSVPATLLAIGIGGAVAHSLRAAAAPVTGVRVTGPDGVRVSLLGADLQRVRLTSARAGRGEGLRIALSLDPRGGGPEYRGADALLPLASILARLNFAGADEDTLRRAIDIVDRAEGRQERAVGRGRAPRRPWMRIVAAHGLIQANLATVSAGVRLALEIAVTEELERDALEGEAEALAPRWQAAEEVAGIADDLFLPAFVTEWIGKRRRSR